ncbi:MAG: DUF5320 domain-containing protein [bacterium]
MPRGDKTGPLGLGPMTGRAAGYCAGYPVPGHANPWPGRGRGMGYGRGRSFGRDGGWGFRYPSGPCMGYPPDVPPTFQMRYPKSDAQNEKSYLENQLKVLQGQVDAIRQRLDELTGREEKA